ncbi:MAG: DUF1549 and DUF1553 domain-containing protein [bacterium]|nr:DUF1549 and DUF1553 domain-containing protein [bacterium]
MRHRPILSRLAFALLVAICVRNGRADETTSFEVLPATINLQGSMAEANVLVQHKVASILGSPVEGAQLRILDESVARIEGHRVLALSDGATQLEVSIPDGSKQQIPLKVSGCSESFPWQFDAHVQAILSRQGCNSGACHGALAGKGGFRLSLRGYDSAADHYTITREDRGRRLEPADPGRSLILAKPAGMIPHKGGLRLPEDSENYRILAEWIASGAPGPRPEDAQLLRIEVLPSALQLKIHDQQPLIVRAHYADGRVEDVTRWAKFSSANEAVAQVDESGDIRVLGPGKGAIVSWFASRIAISSIVVPYDNQVSELAYRDFQPANLIDEILLDEWKSLKLVPSAGCSDETFIRRVHLDATGTLPAPDAVREFIGDHSVDKRQRLVEQLLNSEAFVDYWSYQWSDLLLVNGNLLRPDAVASFYRWIREQVQQNVAWDEFARSIVLARGESLEQGATNFYAIHQDPEALTENTCQAFMGLSIGCAKCHNHPLEKWTNDQYYAMANLYARVRAKGWGGDARNGDGKRTLVVLERGDLIQPNTGQPQPPAPLDAEPIDITSPEDRREVLADWLTSGDNQYFSRSIVNRVWANFMGVGLVESVDDLRVSNPASSQQLLDALANFLIENDYDLKSLMRLILNSAAYQRSAEANAQNIDDQRFYCRYYPRRLMAEVLHDAVVTVTGVPTKFDQIEFQGADKKATDFYPEGTRSIELYDSAVVNYFLKTFGRHQRRITCECERSNEPTVVQVLHLNNGDTINEKLADEACVVTRWLQDNLPAERVVEQAYLATLSRFPSAQERKRMLDLVIAADTQGVERRETYEDLLWSLMTSREFLFSH